MNMVDMDITRTPFVDFKHRDFEFSNLFEIRQKLSMLNPYTMSEPLPHSTLSWKFPIWETGIPISTLISEWGAYEFVFRGPQINYFLEISELGAISELSPQIQYFLELFHLGCKKKVQTFCC